MHKRRRGHACSTCTGLDPLQRALGVTVFSPGHFSPSEEIHLYLSLYVLINRSHSRLCHEIPQCSDADISFGIGRMQMQVWAP